MLQNIKSLSLSGFKELVPRKSQSVCAILLSLLIGSHCQAQVRILDLSEVGPEDFKSIVGQPASSDQASTPNLLLPPIPATDLSQLESISKVGVFDLSNLPTEAEASFLLPPGIDETEVQITSAIESLEAAEFSENSQDFTEQVAEVEQTTLSQIEGNNTVISPESESVERVSYSEMPVVATHQLLGFAHRCTHAVQAPQGNSWIFWKKECRERNPGPVRCSLQSRFVNWRLSSTYLEGCVPEGYSLRHFIEASQIVEFHASTLAENGPVDQGGSFEDAKKIEGNETRPIQQVSIDITPPEGELPMDRAEEKFEQLPEQIQLPGSHRLWCGTSFYWNASLLNHQPLYFEDVNLERNGFSRGCLLQPVVSGMKFFGTLPALPYLMTADPPQETAFTLGQSRPGSHACFVSERPRLQLDAAAVEAAAVVGLVFLIP